MTSVRVSIVSHNNAETIERCLDSVRAQGQNFEMAVTVIDNNSEDNTVEQIRRTHPEVELILPGQNLGFGAGHNLVLRECTEPYVLVLNPDAWLSEETVTVLMQALETDQNIALAGPRMEYADGRLQLSFGKFPGFISDLFQRRFIRAVRRGDPSALKCMERLLESKHEPDWVGGACFLARSKALKQVGYFDERFFLYLEDVDLCRRLRLMGWRVMIEPQARCRHIEGHSHSDFNQHKRHFRRGRLIYENKYGSHLGFYLYKWLRASNVDIRWNNALRVEDSG